MNHTDFYEALTKAQCENPAIDIILVDGEEWDAIIVDQIASGEIVVDSLEVVDHTIAIYTTDFIQMLNKTSNKR